ncbi:MAG: aminotransferase class V-fold PLP-dependent enzyme [Myxococcales bacterium]
MSSELARHFLLDPGIVFLNHGSYGACPRAVLDRQSEWRARMERQPLVFFREVEKLLDEARGALGAFVGADPEDLAFVKNASTGVSTVVRSLDLRPEDELLTTSHAYNACHNTLRAQERRGVKVVVADVPFPIRSPSEVIDAVVARISPRTRLAMVDHVTSPTGLVFPIAEMVRALEERGVDTLVDGAHAPGMLKLDLRALSAAYYTGNCHKWMCTPKGSAFLWVRKDRQEGLLPLTISHGYNAPRTDRSRFRLLFDLQGTDDVTGFLCIAESIRFFESIVPGGFAEMMRRNRALALEARRLLCLALGIREPAPESMIGSLATVPLPDGPAEPLQRALWEKRRIEVPLWNFPAYPRRILRVSAQVYNSLDDYRALGEALPSLL